MYWLIPLLFSDDFDFEFQPSMRLYIELSSRQFQKV
jgi:hypothetical protein